MPDSALWVCFRSLTIEIENVIVDGPMWVADWGGVGVATPRLGFGCRVVAGGAVDVTP